MPDTCERIHMNQEWAYGVLIIGLCMAWMWWLSTKLEPHSEHPITLEPWSVHPKKEREEE